MPSEEHLTADECDELSRLLQQDADASPNETDKATLLKMAEGYRDLANMKRMVLREVN